MSAGKSYAHGSNVESKFASMAKTRGWAVHRSGWPDFLVIRDGKAILVEVKSANDRLRGSQRRMFEALELAGVSVHVWWEECPDTLMHWRRFRSECVQLDLVRRREQRARARARNPGMYGPREMAAIERDMRRMG